MSASHWTFRHRGVTIRLDKAGRTGWISACVASSKTGRCGVPLSIPMTTDYKDAQREAKREFDRIQYRKS